MREVVKIPGDRCSGCANLEIFPGDAMGVCWRFDKKGVGHTTRLDYDADNEEWRRHPLCPYGNRVITVVMTDEDVP